jgi:imidazolonepropionase-like amidohydrolase
MLAGLMRADLLRACLAVPLLPVAFCLSAAAAPPSGFAIRAARVYTGEAVIEGGTVLVLEGKIAAVGREVALPAGIPLIDLPGRSVLPGLIDSETTLAEAGQDTRKSITPEILAADGWDFYADRRRLLQGGVTTVYVSPGSSRLLSGRGMVVKTGGHGEDVRRRVLRRAAGVRVTLGEGPKNPPGIYQPPVPPSPDRPFEVIGVQLPSSRAGAFLALRELLGRAREPGNPDRVEEADPFSFLPRTEGEDPAEALLDVVSGKERLRVQVDRAHDIERTLALAGEAGIGVVLEGAREAYRVSGLIAKAGAPVIFRGEVHPGRPADEDITRPTSAGQTREGTPAALARQGVAVAIDSPTDSEVEDLLLEAAVAVREGLSPALALRAITLTAAEILGVADRVGSIAPGKDADLVVLTGERPFGGDSGAPQKPEAVYVEGELVWSAGPREIPPGTTLIRCGRILTAKEDIPGGIILVREGKILHAGPGAALLAGTAGAEGVPERVIDASGEVVIPGMIDAGSRVGVHADVLLPPLAGETRGAGAGGGRSTYRLADAIDPTDPAISAVLRRGITTAVISPDAVGSVAGQVTAMKLSGGPRSRVIIKENAGIFFTALRSEDLKRAREYHDRWTAYEKPEAGGAKSAAPDADESYEPFRPLFQGKAPAIIQARSRSDLPRILEELAGKNGVSTVVVGPPDLDEAFLAPLKKHGSALLIGPELVVGRPPPLPPLNLPRLASESGMRIALRSGAAAGSRHLPVEVALAVREGWEGREALRALTLYPAQIFKIDDRVGSIEKGKDADLVFLTGDPFGISSRVTRVMVEGAFVYQEGAK